MMKFTVTFPCNDDREYVEYFEAKTYEEAHAKAKSLIPKDPFVDRYKLKVVNPRPETIYLTDDEQFVNAVVTVRCKELDRSHEFTTSGFGLKTCVDNALVQAKGVWGDEMTFEVVDTKRKYIPVPY